ncbi:hypothetical protein MAHJHV49_22960 [Mycobacterium avium subsp. hominissuis]|uniref:Uncharacterized protein n=1 Tax=Mycobacterium alsense TaxID=324058 RepID=A0AA42C3R7_9MYCO|nr:hypothetical protein [Mycobacterium alsense]MCV7382179.1 hypothetical protein [Mycobacterium alsense]OQZ90377.1 hypothetical protein BST11_13425 [Mycobacterium alsense]
MIDNEITTIRPPEDTITVVPTSMEYVYHHVNGHDVLCLLMNTKKHGPMLMALTPDNAAHIAAHLQGMLAQIDELRQKYNER